MSRPSARRLELLQALHMGLRQMSAGAVMFHQAIADRLGLHVTDHKCADLILRHGSMTAGALANLHVRGADLAPPQVRGWRGACPTLTIAGAWWSRRFLTANARQK